jgi:LacI family transcriptional regulator
MPGMTLDEVARRAGVSPATVSRVLNDKGEVKASTRARVLEAVQALKYSPNLHARSLAGGASRSLGVIVSNIENPFFLDIYKAVESGAQAAGYEVIMANTDYRPERLVTSIRLLLGRRPAGLAVIVSEMDATLIDELSAQPVPVVFYDVGTPRPNITNIRVDYRHGVAHLTSYLYSLGHRRLGYIGHHAALAPLHERLHALRAAVARYPDVDVFDAGDADSLDGGRQATRALLDAHPDVTAIVCVNDLMALGALRELRARGRRVPDDVSVTGFDNIALAQYAVPALTTVHIPRDQVGRTICACLMGSDPPRNREIVIEPELVVRESTGRSHAS